MDKDNRINKQIDSIKNNAIALIIQIFALFTLFLTLYQINPKVDNKKK